MTIPEAMRQSQLTGRAFYRDSNEGYGGWLVYKEGWEYRDLTANDLMAIDWILIGTSDDGEMNDEYN